MEIISKINKLKIVVGKEKILGHRIGLVPTMGALHEGHLSLVRRAKRVSDTVIVSIFVNPTQFGPNEDLDHYPRNLSHDVELLTRLDVDYVFTPTTDEVYTKGFETYIEVEGLSDKLCGRFRPGHFRGVTTVVSMLFTMTEPTFAFFGQKDAQQAIIIKKMAQDLNFPIEINICPIVREPDGLTLSSRNIYLDPDERAAATILYRSLRRAAAAVLDGVTQGSIIRQIVEEMVATEPLARMEYVDILDCVNLDPVETISKEALLAMAVYIGQTRLIDNILLNAS